MLEQFRRFLAIDGRGGAGDCCFGQRRENSGVGAGVLELREETIARTERQTARLDFMDHVFIERIASDQSEQLAVRERFALFLAVSAAQPQKARKMINGRYVKEAMSSPG
jgi:hypothetical protein